jgi:hypothetical protein
VNVVGNTAHAQGFSTQVAGDGRQIGVHARTKGGIEPRLAILRAKDHVNDDFTKRLRHGAMMDQKGTGMNRAFSAGPFALHKSLGRCPRLAMNAAPLALNTYPACCLVNLGSTRV